MGKQHLAKLPEHCLVLLVVYRQFHVFQAQSLHLTAALVIADQRHKGTPRLHNGMSQRGSHAVSVAGGTSTGIGHSSGGKDHRVGGIASLFPCHCRNAAILRFNRNGTVMDPANMQRLHLPLQRVGDIERAVGHRKYPVTPFHLQRHAAALKKSHGVPAGKPGKCAVQKPAVAGNVRQQPFQIRVIGNVAAAFSGDIDLFPQPLVGFYQTDLRPTLCGGNSCHQTGGAAADHGYLIHLPLSRKYCIWTTPAPFQRTHGPLHPAFAGQPPESAHSSG